jgi:hypothetical protein
LPLITMRCAGNNLTFFILMIDLDKNQFTANAMDNTLFSYRPQNFAILLSA